MSIQTQQATVFIGGRRRWLTRKGAERAEARAAVRRRCECERGGYDDPGSTCHYHSMDPVKYQRMISLYIAMFVRPVSEEA
jgi:hypothetical protein